MKKNKFSIWPNFSDVEINGVQKVLNSGKVNYLFGHLGKKFENNFSKYFNIKYSVAVSNGTVALELALKAIGISKYDEVIVTPRSYYSSAASIIQANGKPVFADVDLKTQNISINSIKKVLTKKTRAIICVHLGGYPCDMNSIVSFARKNNLFVIEDCSQAHGAKIKDKYVGTFGDIATWSFCNDKIISTGGEGGMISTNKKKYWSFIWSYKDQGKDHTKYFKKNNNNVFKYLHDSFGSNYRMTEMQASLGINQLKKLSSRIKIRNTHANFFNNLLKNYRSINLFEYNKSYTNAYYRYYFKLNSKFLKTNWSRNRILKYLNNFGINCGSGSCPEIYLEKSFTNLGNYSQKVLPNAKILGQKSIALNIHHNLKISEIKYIGKVLNDIFSKATK